MSIDVRKSKAGYTLWSQSGNKREDISLTTHIKFAQEHGAGEIMIQSIENDGKMLGYDMDLIKEVVASSRVPIICGSGAGNFQHLKEAFDAGADAVACGSLFNFGDNNPIRAKSYLRNYGIPLKKA